MTTLKTQLKNATKAALIATFAVTGLYAATNTPALAGERFTDFFTMGVYDYDRKWNQLITENSVDPAVAQESDVAMVGGGERWFWDWGNNEAVESDTETQLAFDHRPCHEGRPGWDWGHGIFGTICVRRVEEGLNAFDAEEQIAFDPISRGETCWIRDYEPVPCPSDSWNAEELNVFEVEEQIARGGVNMNVFNRCEKQHGIAYCLKHRYYNTEELNAFEAEEQIAFDHTPCLRGNPKYRWGNGIFGKICVLQYNKEELNAFDAEAQIAEGAQCIWQGYTVDCDTLDADAQVIATANPYTQDANPADTVDAVSQHLLAGADTDYELQLIK